jgi:hypothetical protein
MTFNSRGKLLTKVEAQVDFQVICAKCHQPVIIASILHFADCPQVSVEPCLCVSIKTVDTIMKEIQDNVQRVDT